ncbi:MAG: zf-HC2 domain-containing protein [bacterium]
MNHKEIQEKLLLFTDGGLSNEETIIVREHIEGCPVCRENSEKLKKVWVFETGKRMKPSPFLWTRLEAEIKDYERNPVYFGLDYFRKRIAYMLQPAMTAVLIFASILAGYFGGNYLVKDLDANQGISGNEQVAEAFYLDKLEPLLMALASGENEKEVLP